MCPTELTKVRDALARALSVDAVNQLGRNTGPAVRLRTVTPHRWFLVVASAPAGSDVESLATLDRAFHYHHGVHVAYKAFCSRLARVGFARFMRGMCARLIERVRRRDPRRAARAGPRGGTPVLAGIPRRSRGAC